MDGLMKTEVAPFHAAADSYAATRLGHIAHVLERVEHPFEPRRVLTVTTRDIANVMKARELLKAEADRDGATEYSWNTVWCENPVDDVTEYICQVGYR